MSERWSRLWDDTNLLDEYRCPHYHNRYGTCTACGLNRAGQEAEAARDRLRGETA